MKDEKMEPAYALTGSVVGIAALGATLSARFAFLQGVSRKALARFVFASSAEHLSGYVPHTPCRFNHAFPPFSLRTAWLLVPLGIGLIHLCREGLTCLTRRLVQESLKKDLYWKAQQGRIRTVSVSVAQPIEFFRPLACQLAVWSIWRIFFPFACEMQVLCSLDSALQTRTLPCSDCLPIGLKNEGGIYLSSVASRTIRKAFWLESTGWHL